MNSSYDAEADVLCFRFSDAPIDEGDEPEPGVIVSFDASGNVVSVEILSASKLNLSQVAHKLLGASLAKC